MTTQERWLRIKEIAGAALEREPVEPGAFLDQACSQDPGLRAEFDSPLVGHAQSGGPSESSWATTVADATGQVRTLGPYRLIQILGVGGMGQVWLAEQTEPVRRRVALKLIRAGMYDRAVAQRFESERQSLAIMEHPAIAKVFDAGTTPAGQPYFAMEYVDGLPITVYCDRKKLGIRERLKLFIQVCEGVQHAHQKAIIHRDLKPSNILVSEVDGKPTPRIIDFGLAKAAVPQAFGETQFTHVGGFLGTPGYMSPEQADANVYDIDTRTDVYSLGIVLYELLTGCLPFDEEQWKKQPLEEVLRQLRETDPERPSTKVSADPETSTSRADARSTEPQQLISLLRGDLDWITLKALERERERRYGTPSALAADVERYLQNLPVEARPAGRVYRLRKYLRRNRVAVTIASGAAALLVAFAVMQTVELRRITRERDRADRITEFMINMFKVSDPSEARGNSITAREILDKSSKGIETGLVKDPELRAQMANVMGDVYEKLGLYSRAQPLINQATETRRRILGSKHPDTLASMDDLAWILYREGHLPEAEKMQRETLEARRLVLGPVSRQTAESAMHLAAILADQGRNSDAEKLDREAFIISERSLGPEDPFTLVTMTNLAGSLLELGRYQEAKTLGEQTLNLERRVLGPDHPTTLTCMSVLATTLIRMERYDEAEELLQQTLDAQRRVLGPDHPDTSISAYNLACLMVKRGDREKAFTLLRDAVGHGLAPDAVLGIEQDPDLQPLHGDSRFAEIVADAHKRAAEATRKAE